MATNGMEKNTISNKRSLLCYLKKNNLFNGCKVLGIKSGRSNNNFIIEHKLKKYTVRTNKQIQNIPTRKLKNEHNVLNFFKHKKINFVPRSIHYDETNNIHILTYIEGRKKIFKNLSFTGMEDAIRKLHEVNTLAEEFVDYCEQNKISPPQTYSVINGNKKRILEKISSVEKIKELSPYKKWLLKKLKNDFTFRDSRKVIYLNHGDPADNLVSHNKLISIIDWEYVKFTYSPGLVYILKFGRLDYEKEKTLLRLYEKVSGISYNELYKKTYTEKSIFYLLQMAKLIEKNSDTDNKHLDNIKLDLDKLKTCYTKIHDRVIKYN